MAKGIELDIKVDGLRELQQRLMQFPDKVQGRAARHALQSGAKVIKERARANHPWQDDTGFLREAIVQFGVKKNEHEYSEQVRVGVKRRKVKRPSKRLAAARSRRQARGKKKTVTPYYWRYLEFGTSRMAAKPFLRPAFESGKHEALRRITETLGNEIEKAAKQK